MATRDFSASAHLRWASGRKDVVILYIKVLVGKNVKKKWERWEKYEKFKREVKKWDIYEMYEILQI